jgi:hypothetical protein
MVTISRSIVFAGEFNETTRLCKSTTITRSVSEGRKWVRFIFCPTSREILFIPSEVYSQQSAEPLDTQPGPKPAYGVPCADVIRDHMSPQSSHLHQSTPPGTVLPPAPTVLPLTLALSRPLFPPPPAAPLHPSCGLAWRRSMNMGLRPSLSSCLKRSRGFSLRPRQRSWSPWTI